MQVFGVKLINERVAFGFEWLGNFCIGIHIHPNEKAIMGDFLGFYLNVDWSSLPVLDRGDSC